MAAVAPYFRPHEVTAGAGDISAENPVPSASYPYPIVVANQDLADNVAYGLIKAMQENFDDYKDNAPGASGYALEQQDLQWVVPFHDAVVEYYKEIDVWTEEMQSHQDKLVERQNVLMSAWESFMQDAPSDDEAFTTEWMEARATALSDAGFEPIFE